MTPRMIILAAGRGTRLQPLTDDRPKCMVALQGRPLLEWQIDTARQAGIDDIIVVRGYLGETITAPGIRYVENARYAETNMVETLFCAREYFSESIIVSYGDIVYNRNVLEAVLQDNSDIGVVVDRDWLPYWQQRFDDPLSDAETLKIDASNHIVEIGQRPSGLYDIQAQYIGLSVYRNNGVRSLEQLYDTEKGSLANGKRGICSSRVLSQLYMTDMLQGLINKGYSVVPLFVSGGWLEVDSLRDLEVANRFANIRAGELLVSRTVGCSKAY